MALCQTEESKGMKLGWEGYNGSGDCHGMITSSGSHGIAQKLKSHTHTDTQETRQLYLVVT
jgi:hypothetical protein